MTAAAAGPPLPVDAVLDAVRAAVAQRRPLVVTAAPGSGKTTRVPAAVAEVVEGRVVVLQPRRVAARSLAAFLAGGRGEAVGDTVGLTTRDERRVGPRTRIEFVTEGILGRRLQHDPELPGIGAVVFDEFHERSLATDTGLALTLDVVRSLRPDLAVVVMSATLDVDAVAHLLGDAEVVEAPGTGHPVVTRHRPRDVGTTVEAAVVAAVGEALAATPGDVLVFLPGAAEIHRTQRLLTTASGPGRPGGAVDVLPLHGQLSAAEQDRALAPAGAGRRKVVLATNVAETSLTVEGVTAVVDSGLVRRVRAASGPGGFARLVTERVTRAEADQRRGRAGRTAPGACYRLWPERDDAGLRAAPRPEIVEQDLTGLALELAAWGCADPADLAWLDAPPTAALDAGRRTLRTLALLDERDRPTPDGRAVLRLGLDPRAGAMVLAGRRAGADALRTACRIAALIEEGDVFERRGPGGGPLPADLALRLDVLAPDRLADGSDPVLPDGVAVRRDRRRRIITRATAIERRAARLDGPPVAADRRRGRDPGTPRRRRGGTYDAGGAPDGGPGDDPGDDPGGGTLAALLLAGFADRLARRRDDGQGRYRLRHGGGVRLSPTDPLARQTFVVVIDAGGTLPAGPAGTGAPGPAAGAADPAAEPAVRLAAAVPAAALPTASPVLTVRWDPGIGDGGDVTGRREERLDALVLRSGPVPASDLRAADTVGALLDGIRRNGFTLLGNHDAGDALRRRVAYCRRRLGDDWPDLSDAALLATLDDWLTPWLAGARRRRDLAAVDALAVWSSLLGPGGRGTLDRLAPARVVIPTGRTVAVDYTAERPTVSAKLQELFGWRDVPVLAGGEALVVQLLSPAGRPVAVTDDLGRFWQVGYPQVRAELRGRYPRHPWPEDPTTAVATATTKRRAGR